ncbi:hypothetical protein [Blastococcus sp. KM273129]|uniref:hypothetical protein n=1 Tax=Blastococcus sp. KM273129 TaxID=2570315 RepID=UPI001F2D9747|nr:hypothetical protein [Blastococcus sp. KM273129]
MSGMLMLLSTWAAVALPVALLIGKSVRLADMRGSAPGAWTVPDFMPTEWTMRVAGSR